MSWSRGSVDDESSRASSSQALSTRDVHLPLNRSASQLEPERQGQPTVLEIELGRQLLDGGSESVETIDGNVEVEIHCGQSPLDRFRGESPIENSLAGFCLHGVRLVVGRHQLEPRLKVDAAGAQAARESHPLALEAQSEVTAQIRFANLSRESGELDRTGRMSEIAAEPKGS